MLNSSNDNGGANKEGGNLVFYLVIHLGHLNPRSAVAKLGRPGR